MPLNRPTLRELEDAIAQHRASPPADPRVARFHDRIAAHLQALIEREQALGPDFIAREQALLGQLLDKPADDMNQALCSLLDQGLNEALTGRLLPALLEIAEAKLAIDNPRYLPAQSD